MLKIGLTGGIGSGKSYVANLLHQSGAGVIDTDVLAHRLTASDGLAMPLIVDKFGQKIASPDGSLNRPAMRDLVFNDPQARHELQSILHPLIAQAVADEFKLVKGLYTVIVVPLLVESGRWIDRVDRICVVDCDVPTQIQRVTLRSGLTVEQVQLIMAAQATRDQRLQVADDVIDNGADTDELSLTKQTLELHQQWCNLMGNVQ